MTIKKILIGIVVLASFLGAFSLYLLLSSNDFLKKAETEIVPATPVEKTEAAYEAVQGSGSIKDLLALRRNLECKINIKAVDGEPETEGTIFISGNLMRSDLLSKIEGVDSVTSIIMRDGYFYNWTEVNGEKFAVKFDLSQTPQSDAAAETTPRELASLDQSLSYDCSNWVNIDNSIFELPKDVLFKDLADVMSTGMEYGNVYETPDSNPCNTCSKISGDAKKQCLAAFGCE